MSIKQGLKYLFIAIISTASYSFTHAVIDFTISQASLTNNTTSVVQFSVPQISLQVSNIGSTDAIANNISAGFITCTRAGTTIQQVYSSNPINALFIAAGSFQNITSVSLRTIITNSVGNKNITCTINANNSIPEGNTNNNTINFSFAVIASEGGRFDGALSRSIESIQGNLEAREASSKAAGVVNFVVRNTINIIIPIIIVIAVIVAVIGFYKVMIQEGEDSAKKGVQYIIRGVVGIMIMVSARYVGTVIMDQVFNSGNLQAFSGVNAISILYDNIVFPFLKVIIYIVLGILFIILLIRLFTFITTPSEDIKKQSVRIIIRNIVAMLIILGSTQIVELVYGQKNQVLQQNAQNLGDIGAGIFNNNIPIIYQIINRVLGLTAFIILILIIFQSYQLLTKPDDPETFKKIKKNIGYIAAGILVIGAGYVIVNFLIIN